MAKAYKALLNSKHCRWWLERDGDNYNVPIRLVIHSDDGSEKTFRTPDLNTYEIGALAMHFARVYFERTKKVIWPVAGQMLDLYEKARIDAVEEHYRWMQASPVTEINQKAIAFAKEAGLIVDPLDDDPLKESKANADCPFCDGNCTGACV